MEPTFVQMGFELNAETFSWQKVYFEMLHDSLVEAANEILPKEEDVDIEWKDTDMIQGHALNSGLLERTISLMKEKFLS